MQYLAMQTNDIRTNLATEQYLLNSGKIKPPFMLFYIEKPCIIVGRNQNTMEEIDPIYCQENGVTVTRRLSGGGAVYQDLGNLCYSFVVPAEKQQFGDFSSILQPIVDVLHDMGATGAQVNGRNDIIIDNKKFSGNAMYTKNGISFCHGTLMFDVDTSAVASALRVPQDKIESKGIKSVRSRVTNIKPYLKPAYQDLDAFGFRDELIKKLLKVDTLEQAQAFAFNLDETDKKEIEKITQELYSNWDWVYGKSPEFSVQRRQKFVGGTIDARYVVENGKITIAKIYGDFFGAKAVNDLETALIGVVYDADTIAKALADFDLSAYFSGIEPNDVIDLLSKQK